MGGPRNAAGTAAQAAVEVTRPNVFRRPALWLPAVAALALTGVVLSLELPAGPRIGTVTRAGGGSEAIAPLLPSGSAPPEDVVDPTVRRVAIERLLSDRAFAITHDDAPRWQRQQVTGARAPEFDRLAALPIERWRYTVEGTSSGADPLEVVVRVSVAYRLDADAEDALLRERLTLRHSGTEWRVVTEATEGPRAQPWDLGTLRVARGRTSVVIGIDVAQQTVNGYAALADRVAADVTEVWGSGWTRRPVLVVPRSTAMLARGLARQSASLTRIAAVTTAEDGDGSGADVRGADRVWTNTPVMGSLSALGREIVLRHEVLHVATGAAATNATPLWLEEGMAEYVGYRGSGVALGIAAGDVLREVRAGQGPTRLPEPADFGGARLAQAYESAHVACDLVADEVGVAGLTRLYRLTAGAGGSAAANVDEALRTVLGLTIDQFETRWRARLRALAG